VNPTNASNTGSFSALELMGLHVHACYLHDDAGRLVRANEPAGEEAPRFWLGLTNQGAIWRFGRRASEDVIKKLNRLCESEGLFLDSPSTSRSGSQYENLLAHSEGPLVVSSGPTYWLPEQQDFRSTAVELSPAQTELLRGTLDEWIPDLAFRHPFLVSMSASKAVSVCASVRVTALADEAGVETAPAYRQLGHAANAVEAWTTAVLAMGKIPLYSTSWDNQASQSLARSLGFKLFGEEYSIQ